MPQTAAVPRRRLHPRPISVWASHTRAHLNFADPDARLPNPGGGDQTFGQDGWNVGFNFSSFRSLASKLSRGQFELPSFICGNRISGCGPIGKFQVHRLAIEAHGAPGIVDIDGVFDSARAADTALQTDPRFLSALTLRSRKYDVEITQIGERLHENSVVFFMGCRIASGPFGEEFLKEMSLRWFGTRIVAIKSIGVSDEGRQARPFSQGSSSFPGMRDTRFPNHKQPGGPERDFERLEVWNDLARLPWASDRSPHASVAFKGVMITDGQEPAPVF